MLAAALLLLLAQVDTASIAADHREDAPAAAEQGDQPAVDPDDDSVLILDDGGSAEAVPPSAEARFDPTARATIRLEARAAMDTAFDESGEHVAQLGLGGRLELEVDITRELSAYVAPNFFYAAGFDREGSDREVLYLVTPEARVSLQLGAFDLRAGALIFNWGAS